MQSIMNHSNANDLRVCELYRATGDTTEILQVNWKL